MYCGIEWQAVLKNKIHRHNTINTEDNLLGIQHYKNNTR